MAMPRRYGLKKIDNKFPGRWSDKRARAVLSHYERQSQDEAAKEDEAAFRRPSATVMKVPRKLVPAVRKLLATHKEP